MDCDQDLPEAARQAGPVGRANTLDDLVQRQALAEGHGKPAQAAIELEGDRVHRDDVGMVQHPLGLGLLALVQRDLQDHALAAQRKVPGQEDARRSPLADERDQLIFLESVTRLWESEGWRSRRPAAWLKMR